MAANITSLNPPLMRKISSGLSEIFEKLSDTLENILDPLDLDNASSSLFINCATHSPTVMSLRAEKIELMQQIAELASENVAPVCIEENELQRKELENELHEKKLKSHKFNLFQA